jgi:hypothetical protein
MNFYRVQIGKNTKRGGFNEMHSFVCQDESAKVYDIQTYFNKKYEGFDVNVTPVVNIVSTNVGNDKELSLELKSANKKIKELETKNGHSTSVYNGSLWYGDFDEESTRLYKEYQSKLKAANAIKKECRNYLVKKLSEDNKSICKQIEFVSFDNEYFKYKMRLNGNIVKE